MWELTIKGVYVLNCHLLIVVCRTEADGLLVNIQKARDVRCVIEDK